MTPHIAAAKRDVFIEWPIANDYPSGVDAGVTGKPFEYRRVTPELLGGFFGCDCLLSARGSFRSRLFNVIPSSFESSRDAVGIGIA